MKIAYIDTSVLVAMAFDDGGGAFITRAVRSFDRLYAAALVESEFIAQAVREDCLDQVGAFLAPVRIVRLASSLLPQISTIVAAGQPTGASLHHLATALYLFPAPKEAYFLSLNEPQAQLAAKLGFRTDFL